MVKFYPKFHITLGSTGNGSVYVKDNNGDWQEFINYEYFKVIKKQNQVSEFEIRIMDLESADKLYVKEFAEVLFLSENNLILKGRIQKISYETAYECTATGFGIEAKLLEKELIKSGDKRVQYTNESAQTIANEILSSNTDGSSPWIITPNTTGLFDTDYGTISIRYEYGNRLNSLAKLAEAIDYEWGVSQDYDHDKDSFDIAPLLPDSTRATVSQETFEITGASANCYQTANEKDITNLANKIDALGYGDGVNQKHTSTYNASETYSMLASDITSTSTTIALADASSFSSSGEIRIMEERITYSGKSGNNLTGCTRGANSTTALAHKKNVYAEKYVAISSAESGSSIGTNGLMDYTITERDIIDVETLELIASRKLLERMDTIVRIKITPNEPLETAGSRKIGDLITINDTESDISGDYRIVGILYTSEYGDLNLEIEASNKSLTFIEQMQKQREQAENLSKYMQGATNLYWFGNEDNCDSTHPLELKIYVPEDAVAINSVKLNFNRPSFRGYSATNVGGSYSIISAPLDKEVSCSSASISLVDNVDHSGSWVSNIFGGSVHNYQSTSKTVGSYFYDDTTGNTIDVFDSGTAESGGNSTLTDTDKSWTIDEFGNRMVHIFAGTGNGQTNWVVSNTSDTLTINGTWATNPDSTSQYYIFGLVRTLTTNTGFNYTVTDLVTDRRGHTILFGVAGFDSTNALDTGDNYQSSTNVNIIDFGIYEPGSENDVNVTVNVGGSDVTTINSVSVGDTTSSDIDVTSYITDTGWHTIKLTPTAEARLSLTGYTKCFIESK